MPDEHIIIKDLEDLRIFVKEYEEAPGDIKLGILSTGRQPRFLPLKISVEKGISDSTQNVIYPDKTGRVGDTIIKVIGSYDKNYDFVREIEIKEKTINGLKVLINFTKIHEDATIPERHR